MAVVPEDHRIVALSVTRLAPGDVVVLKIKGRHDRDTILAVEEMYRGKFGDAGVVVIDESVELSILKKDIAVSPLSAEDLKKAESIIMQGKPGELSL